MTIQYKYVQHERDRHGKERWYFRRQGQGRIRLPGGPEHPHFRAAYHAAMKGAPQSRTIKLPTRRGATGYVYFLKVGSAVKIGYSVRPLSRLDDLKTGVPLSIDTFVCVRGSQAHERMLHRLFARSRQEGEWFEFAPEIAHVMARAAAYGTLPTVESENKVVPLPDSKVSHFSEVLET